MLAGKQALHTFRGCWISWRISACRESDQTLHRTACMNCLRVCSHENSLLCLLNQDVTQSRAEDSFQPPPCKQLRISDRNKLPLAAGLTQIQVTALRKKIEGMLVCIVHGATVLISRHEKLNSLVLDFLAP